MVGVERAFGYGGFWSGLPTLPTRVVQITLPSAVEIAWTYSLSMPRLLIMYRREPTTTGVEKPSPTSFTCHSSFGPPAGHCLSKPVSFDTPLRSGPRHCG